MLKAQAFWPWSVFINGQMLLFFYKGANYTLGVAVRNLRVQRMKKRDWSIRTLKPSGLVRIYHSWQFKCYYFFKGTKLTRGTIRNFPKMVLARGQQRKALSSEKALLIFDVGTVLSLFANATREKTKPRQTEQKANRHTTTNNDFLSACPSSCDCMRSPALLWRTRHCTNPSSFGCDFI